MGKENSNRLVGILMGFFLVIITISISAQEKSQTLRREDMLKIAAQRDKKFMQKFKGAIASYGMEPRYSDGRLNISRLIRTLKNAHINTHCYIMYSKRDWILEDFEKLLEAARKAGIKLWTTLLPPAEDGANVIPYGTDYIKWSEELARLSMKYPNFQMWTIDDFSHELGFFTPDYVSKFVSAARAINPELAFGVCVYYPAVKRFVEGGYAPLVDMVVYWGYRSESVKFGGSSWAELVPEIEYYEKMLPGKPVFPIIYVSRHSRWPKDLPTLEYIEQCLKISREKTGVVFMYCLPLQPDNEKYQLAKEIISDWEKRK